MFHIVFNMKFYNNIHIGQKRKKNNNRKESKNKMKSEKSLEADTLGWWTGTQPCFLALKPYVSLQPK